MLVNILAVVLLLAAIYSAVAFIIIPVSKFMWVMLVNSVKDGYQQFLTVADIFMHWDMALYLLLGLSIYLVPTIIAFQKKHPSKRSILFTNILIGWSVIGWILALIWCFSSDNKSRRS
jgi:hypothetical protein